MEIRKVTPDDDFEAISLVYAKSWKTAYRGIIPQSYLDALSDSRWAPILKTSPFTALILTEGDQIIGTSSFGKARDETKAGWGEIVSIYLLPECYGKGYGKTLFQRVIAELKQSGYQQIYLWVLTDNQRARQFYERNGFRNSGDTTSYEIGGEKLLEVRYVYSEAETAT